MRRLRRKGFTLLEVVLATALLAAVMGAALMVVQRGRSVMAEGHLHARAEARAHRALQRVLAELRCAGIDALVPALNPNGLTSSATLTFDPILGVSAGTARKNRRGGAIVMTLVCIVAVSTLSVVMLDTAESAQVE